MRLILILSITISMFVTLVSLPWWIKKMKKIGFLWKDMNKIYVKRKSKKIPASGGVCVMAGFVIGVLSYIAIKTFYLNDLAKIIEIFALLTSILILTLMGIVDDFLGWRHGGMNKWSRLLLAFFASIPLIVINAGQSEITLPLLNGIDIGLLYPLLAIPIGIIGTSITYNFLAGFNGLEASQGIIILTGIGFVTFFIGHTWLSLICLCMIASLIIFYIFNKYPAKVFPGNSMTYSIGALIAIMAILGDMERIAVFFFIPYILETFLKLRGGLKKQSFGKPNKDGSLDLNYNKIYGLEHLSIFLLKKIKPSKKVYEKDVVLLINIFQILIIVLGILIFREHIFLM